MGISTGGYMNRILGFFFTAVLLLCLLISCSSAPEKTENPFKAFEQQDGELTLYYFDGETTRLYGVQEPATDLISRLAAGTVFKSSPYTMDKKRLPCYGIRIMKDGRSYDFELDKEGMIDPSGNFYSHELELPRLLEAFTLYEMESPAAKGCAHYPCFYYLLKGNGSWMTEYMTEAESPEKMPHEYSLETVRYDEETSVMESTVKYEKFTGTVSDPEDVVWNYNVFYQLQTEQHGKWFILPFHPEAVYQGGFDSMIPGNRKTYSLDVGKQFGELPDGSYRWEVMEGVYVLFSVKGGRLIPEA